MNYTYFIADVFTQEVFNGAQIAVFPNAEGLDNQQMALVARELNLTETVFLRKTTEQKNTFRMQIFSPLGEINFAGHPIIAAAHVLAISGEINLDGPYSSITFQQNAATVETNISNENGQPGLVQFSRTVAPIVDYYAPTEAELAAFLNIPLTHIDHKKYATRLVSCDVPYLVVPVFYYETVRQARFDFAAWSQTIAPQTAAQEILLVSPKTPYKDSDFAVRLVGPNIGVHDDPPVGSAMPALAAYLCSFTHMQKGTYTFAVERGDQSIRRSLLHLEMDHKGEDTLTLRVGGKAIKVAEGVMTVPES